MATAAELVVKVKGDIQQLTQSLQTAGTNIQVFVKEAESANAQASSPFSFLAGAIAKVGAVAGVAFTAAAGAGVNFNSQMEQYRQTLNIVMKDQQKAAEIMQWAVDFAAKTPFELPGIVEATTRLQAYGINAQAVLQDVGDMAAALGKPLMQAVEAIADAQTGELERLKEFGITKQMLIQKAQELGKGEIVNAKGQITNLQALNETLITIMRERYHGAMEAQSTTFSGMISNLKDWFNNSMAILAQDIFADLKVHLKNLLDYLNQLKQSGQLQVWANNITVAFRTVVNWVAITYDRLRTIYNFISRNWSTLSPIIMGIASAFAAFKVVNTVTNLFNTLRTSIGLLQGAFTFLTSPMGLVVVAIGALVAAMWTLYKNWDTVRQWLIDKFGKFGEWVVKLFEWIGDKLAKLGQWIKGILGIEVPDATAKASQGMGDFRQAEEQVEQQTKKTAEAAFSLGAAMGSGPNSLAGGASKASGSMKEVKSAAEKLKEAIDKVKETVSTAKDKISTEVDIIKTAYEIWQVTTGKNASETQKLTKENEVLQAEIKRQQEKIAAIKKAYDDMVKLTGAWSLESRKLWLEFQQGRLELAKLNEEIERNKKLREEAQNAKAPNIFAEGVAAKDVENYYLAKRLEQAFKSGQTISSHGGVFSFGQVKKFHTGGTFYAPTPGGEGLALLRDREVILTPEDARGIGQNGAIVINMTGLFQGATIVGEADLISRAVDAAKQAMATALTQQRRARIG